MTRALALVAVALVAGACSRDAGSREEPAGHASHGAPSGGVPGMAEVDVAFPRRQAMGVRTAVLAVRPLVQRVRTVGTVVADERRVRKIQTKVSGWVERLFVAFAGQQVKTGDPILSIYSPELVTAQREYLLALRASRNGEGGGRALLESARSRLLFWDVSAAQVAELERSGVAQRTLALHSPIAGYVTVKPVYGGMYVTPEMELYTVTDLGSVWVWADLYESELELVRPGQAATLILASSPGQSRRATVSYVNPTMEPATRTLRVRLDVDNAGEELKPGMYATVELEVPLGEALALPEDAVIDTGERRVVFVDAGEGRYQPREVSLGRRAERHYEVRGGLTAGERVVVSAQFLLDSESRLRAAAGGPAHGVH